MSKFALSQIPVNPNFRDSSVNTVVVVPLLSQKGKADGSPGTTRSTQSFNELLASLRRHTYTSQSTAEGDLILVVPNSALTRPGDWRYSDTPLKSFHWQHGCQRLLWHDGRPQHSRRAHDKLFGNNSSRSWIDLYPHRRTAAIVGVLNMHDCSDADVLQLAIEELHQWAVRYSMPPYQATALGRSFDRDMPVERLFVFDSFDDENQDLNLSQRKLGTSILAFPPSDETHQQMMDLHMNVVISDLTVAIFRDLEAKIQESSDLFRSSNAKTPTMRSAISRYVSGNSGDTIASEDEPLSAASKNLGVGQLAGLVSPDSKLAKDSPKNVSTRASGNVGSTSEFAFPAVSSTASSKVIKPETQEVTANRKIASSKLPQLMTPMDDDAQLVINARDTEALHKRDQARREKYAADLCLLAGSPLDAYERYLKAAESCKTSADPLWYAVALEGCAAAHIAMAEAGGFSVDEYLENNFQMPEDIMAKARDDPVKSQQRQSTKQTLPEIIFELCEEALNIVNRTQALVYIHTELLLKLASYCAEESEAHLRCRWGEGDACYAGEPGDTPRWERTSVSKLSFNSFMSDSMGDMLSFNTYVRVKKVCNLLCRAVAIEGIDHATRIDVAIRGAQICLNGIKVRHVIRINYH
jgi:Transport protein Trs120 or TRAPPC9, TRAPP II complex subunit